MGYLLYSTDQNHTHQSKKLIGVFSEYGRLMTAAGKLMRAKSKKEFEDHAFPYWHSMYDQELELFIKIKQTQGFSENLIFEEVKFNKILD